jgi:hypothetical protein
MSIKSQGAAAPIKGLLAGEIEVAGRYTSSAVDTDLTKTAGGRGIVSIAQSGSSGSGVYVITFADVGQVLVSWSFGVLNTTATAAAQKTVNVTAYDATAKTMTILVVNCAATPAVEDLAASDQLTVRVLWADSGAA